MPSALNEPKKDDITNVVLKLSYICVFIQPVTENMYLTKFTGQFFSRKDLCHFM